MAFVSCHSSSVMGRTKNRSEMPMPSRAEHVQLEFETVLRIRPLLKKEKSDQIVLEPRRMRDGRPATAVLHPMMAKQKRNPESPAMKMLSPETLHLCKDTEYHLNRILPENADQEKVYYSLGLPIVRNSMDFLKFKRTAKGVRREANLIIGTGVDNSGITHTCFGGVQGNIPKRRSSDDGLVPRILDSIFSQSKHHVKNRGNLTFAVKMSLVQVLQNRSEQTKHEDDSILQDLLLPSLNKAASSPLRSPSPSRLASVKSLVTKLEKARSSATGSISANARMEAKVTLSQNHETGDFSTNAIVKTCQDIIEARELLSAGLQESQKLTSRNTRAHVLATLQPVLLGQDGSVEREGAKIGILDMVGIEQSSQKRRNTTARRHRDCVGTNGPNDQALNALLHCIRTLQHNSMVLLGKTPALDIVDGTKDGMPLDDTTSEISCVSQEKMDKHKGLTFKVVPYRQHNLTMLLQPFFSSKENSVVNLTFLMVAYPGHRDYAEKRMLLNDLELFYEASRENEEGEAVTGFEKRVLPPIPFSPSSEEGDEQSIENNDPRLHTSTKMTSKEVRESPAPSAPTLDSNTSSSLAYSTENDEDLVPLPPPYAPNATLPHAVAPPASVPSAPIVVDFPGVVIPPAKKKSPLRQQRPVDPHPCQMERSFEQEPPPKKPNAPIACTNEPLKPLTLHNIENRKSPSVSGCSPSTILFEGTKSAMSYAHASAKKGKKLVKKMITTETSPNQATVHDAIRHSHSNTKINSRAEKPYNDASRSRKGTSKLGTVVAVSSPPMGSKDVQRNQDGQRSQGGDATVKRLQILESQNSELCKRNKKLEASCRNLSAENAALKRSLGEYKKVAWSREEEEAWQNSRKSLAAPSLIQSPLTHHLDEVQRTFETNGRWNVAVGKNQFKLNIPSSFKKASELDARDRQECGLVKAPEPQENLRGEKRKESKLKVFQKSLEQVKRRKSSFVSGVRDSRSGR